MKKIINMILVTTLSLSLIGCKESVVLEEKVKSIDGVKSFNVVETPIEIEDQLIYPSLFINDNVYGAEAIRSDSDYSSIIGLKGYYIDKDGNYNVDNESKIFLTEFGNVSSMSYCGLTKEYDNRYIPIDEKEYYYRDNLNDITIKIEGLNELVNEINLLSSDYLTWDNYILGDNKYFVLILNLYNDDLSSSNLIEQTLFIIEMESGKTIKVKAKNKDESSSILYMYYDENINSIMAIMSDNKVKKITITDNDIKLENYKELNFQDYELYSDFGNYIKSYKDSLIFTLKDKDNFSEENFIENTRFGVYNKITGEVQLLDKDIFVMEVLGESNLISVIYNDYTYLAQIDEDNNIELIYKFDKQGYDHISIYGVVNEEGNRLFIRKTLFNNETPSYNKPEYSFIDLK
ncbi:hypothetical protein [uncultured Clostridium sp.]|uniref:hypothetical protein n=1 Tax=uncultured Clostridium sp. TaxID=59620 RepID=UPI0025F3053B|nr:hypothetical protein [uncultured Clostridium sp.]MDU4884364.1 hypothetical protein [Clostridium celatum]MDU7077540.1 hypothetical protein [Clostridium celatum]